MDLSENRKLRIFLAKIKKNFGPCKVFLFGSRAKGESWRQSDYDMIIVSEKFKEMHWLTRIRNIMKYWDLEHNLDVLPYSFEEFEFKKKEFSFMREILKKSKNLA